MSRGKLWWSSWIGWWSSYCAYHLVISGCLTVILPRFYRWLYYQWEFQDPTDGGTLVTYFWPYFDIYFVHKLDSLRESNYEVFWIDGTQLAQMGGDFHYSSSFVAQDGMSQLRLTNLQVLSLAVRSHQFFLSVDLCFFSFWSLFCHLSHPLLILNTHILWFQRCVDSIDPLRFTMVSGRCLIWTRQGIISYIIEYQWHDHISHCIHHESPYD